MVRRRLPLGQHRISRTRLTRWWTALGAALLWGCGAGDTVQPPDIAAVVSVRVIPGSATVVVGDTTQLGVLAEDELGRALLVPVTWRSLDPTVATVQHGVVRGVGSGATRVIATAAHLADTAMVVVRELEGIQESRTLDPAEVLTLGVRNGLVYEIPDIILAGDDDVGGFVPLQALVRYSLESIPAGVQFERAHIRVAMNEAGIFGNPFSLGTLFVERAAGYAVNLQTPSSAAVPLTTFFAPAPVADVTALVRAAYRAGDRSVLLRLRFAQHSNANGRADQLEMMKAEIAVEYVR